MILAALVIVCFAALLLVGLLTIAATVFHMEDGDGLTDETIAMTNEHSPEATQLAGPLGAPVLSKLRGGKGARLLFSGAKLPNHYTHEERAYIAEHYPALGSLPCAKHLNRSPEAINAQAARLGLHRIRPNRKAARKHGAETTPPVSPPPLPAVVREEPLKPPTLAQLMGRR